MKAPPFLDVKVVGMHFREREGIPAKSIVANFVPPVQLDLMREPSNPYDSFAVKVLYQNQHIAYIEASVSCFLAPWMDQGNAYTCTVTHLVEERNNLYPIVKLLPIPPETKETETLAEEPVSA